MRPTSTALAATRTSNPEESTSYEISLSPARSANGSRSRSRAFRNDIDDLIDFVVIDPDTFEGENRNVDKARIDGFEAAWQYDGERWSAARGGDAARTRATGRPTQRLLRRARENYTAAVAAPLRGAANSRSTSSTRANGAISASRTRPCCRPTGSRTSRPGSPSGSALLCSLRAENLFDEDYELASGFNTMGQSFFGALRYEFR